MVFWLEFFDRYLEGGLCEDDIMSHEYTIGKTSTQSVCPFISTVSEGSLRHARCYPFASSCNSRILFLFLHSGPWVINQNHVQTANYFMLWPLNNLFHNDFCLTVFKCPLEKKDKSFSCFAGSTTWNHLKLFFFNIFFFVTLFEIFIFCPKIQLSFPETIDDFFWVKNSWKCWGWLLELCDNIWP